MIYILEQKCFLFADDFRTRNYELALLENQPINFIFFPFHCHFFTIIIIGNINIILPDLHHKPCSCVSVIYLVIYIITSICLHGWSSILYYNVYDRNTIFMTETFFVYFVESGQINTAL